MATVPGSGLPYPIGTDLVRDGDNAIQSLAELATGMHTATSGVPNVPGPYIAYVGTSVTTNGSGDWGVTYATPLPGALALTVAIPYNTGTLGMFTVRPGGGGVACDRTRAVGRAWQSNGAVLANATVQLLLISILRGL